MAAFQVLSLLSKKENCARQTPGILSSKERDSIDGEKKRASLLTISLRTCTACRSTGILGHMNSRSQEEHDRRQLAVLCCLWEVSFTSNIVQCKFSWLQCQRQTFQFSRFDRETPVWDAFPRSPGFTSNCHGKLIPTLAPSLGLCAQPYYGEDKTQARSALRARVLASPD